jgi:hypothetical protein
MKILITLSDEEFRWLSKYAEINRRPVAQAAAWLIRSGLITAGSWNPINGPIESGTVNKPFK